MLAQHQAELSRHFARRDRPRGRHAFSGVEHRMTATGSPVLAGAGAYFDCRLTATHDAGDHVILVGEVREVGREPGAAPLLFHAGQYCALPGEASEYQLAA